MTSSSTVAGRHATDQPPHILVVRNDKLGDFMLAWPALACLKAGAPEARVSVLVPSYTAPIARLCPWIDEVILDPGDAAGKAEQRKLLARLRSERFTAMLTLFSTPRIGWLGWRAGIPRRLAPATKWAQLFYNHRIVQRRSRSAKPEYLYNIELAEALLRVLGRTPLPRPTPPYWPLAPEAIKTRRQALAAELGLDMSRPWLFLHAGSGGSAVNLSLEQYAELVAAVSSQLADEAIHPHWLLTAGPGEESSARALGDSLTLRDLTVTVLPPRDGLGEFALTLATADLFIAGSTGPLHIAGCLDIATAGFYPAHRSATPLRWQTCNRAEHRLAFCPAADSDARDMARIPILSAAEQIANLLLSRNLRQASS